MLAGPVISTGTQNIGFPPATGCHSNLIKGCWARVQKSPNAIEQMYHFPDVSAAVLEASCDVSDVRLRSTVQ